MTPFGRLLRKWCVVLPFACQDRSRCQFVPLLERLHWIPRMIHSLKSTVLGEVAAVLSAARGRRDWGPAERRWAQELQLWWMGQRSGRLSASSTEEQPSPSEKKACICPGVFSLPRAWRNSVSVWGPRFYFQGNWDKVPLDKIQFLLSLGFKVGAF